MLITDYASLAPSRETTKIVLVAVNCVRLTVLAICVKGAKKV